MRVIAVFAGVLLLTGCAGTAAETSGSSGNQPVESNVATESPSRTVLKVSETATCHAIIGDDGGIVVKAANFLTDMTEISESTVAEATVIGNALDGAASTASERFEQLLVTMKEPFDDFIDSYEKNVTFEFVAERFKASSSEVVEVCGTLITSPALQAPTPVQSSSALPSVASSTEDAAEVESKEQAQAKKEAEAKAAAEAEAKKKADAEAKAEAEAKAKAEADAGSTSQQNARRLAENYLEYTAFSRKGLINQLKYEGFSVKDATWALDHMSVDWNAQAAAMAKNYIDYTAFSKKSLTEQLIYEGFTPKQAQYGVSKTGL